MKEKNKIIIAIAAIALIIIIAGGATFAYWYWETATNEETTINFIVGENEIRNEINATLSGATQNITNLIPVASCTDSTYAIKKELTLTYKNDTDNEAVVRGTLSVNFKDDAQYDIPSANNLGYLKYAVTRSATSCTTDAVLGATGSFSTASGALFSNVTLLSGIAAHTSTEQTQTFYLWVWLDGRETDENNDGIPDGYVYTNIGSGSVTDPMQKISFDLTWTGTISNDT